MRPHIRWMIRRDYPEVLAIEQESHALPWSEEDFVRVLSLRSCIGMVAELPNDTIAGFTVCELAKHSLEYLNLAVAKRHRRQGVGAALVGKLKTKLSSHQRTRIGAMVRESNLAAQCFFRAQGFRAVDVKRGQFEDTGEDAFCFRYALPIAAMEDVSCP